jgi:hypothetical protein
MRLLLPFLVATGVVGLFAQSGSHPNFTGNWHFDAAKSEVRVKYEVTDRAIQQDGDSIVINEQVKGQTVSMKCGTEGNSCKAKLDGENGEVMFYFNGEMLVETDFLGRDKGRVVKKRIKLAGDGKTMEIEVLHVNPVAPPEKWVFEKQ